MLAVSVFFCSASRSASAVSSSFIPFFSVKASIAANCLIVFSALCTAYCAKVVPESSMLSLQPALIP